MGNIVDQVKNFVSDHAGVDRSCLELETTIVGDLSMEGGLGVELIFEFASEFGVDMSEFNADDYFGPEAYLPRFVLKFFGIHRAPPELVPISIGDLVAAVELGKWKRP